MIKFQILQRKDYWWDIWGIKKSEFKGQIWRIEARAGKKELNKWNLRRFADFEKMAGDVISGILKDIKYTIPSDTDKNITRWALAPFWQVPPCTVGHIRNTGGIGRSRREPS